MTHAVVPPPKQGCFCGISWLPRHTRNLKKPNDCTLLCIPPTLAMVLLSSYLLFPGYNLIKALKLCLKKEDKHTKCAITLIENKIIAVIYRMFSIQMYTFHMYYFPSVFIVTLRDGCYQQSHLINEENEVSKP